MTEQIRVLHVDDEPDFGDMTATFLERENDRLKIETATEANEGLELLASREYDCVVSDYDMPRMDGIEFLESVREEYPDLPFILFTGKGSEEVASEAISKGVTDYLQKESGTGQYELLSNRVVNAVQKHMAEERADWHKSIIRNMGEGVYVTDSDHILRFVNFRTRDELSPEEDLIGRSISFLSDAQIIAQKKVEMINEGIDRILEGETEEVRIELETGLSESEKTELRLREFRANGENLVLGTTRDLTERKYREKELRRLKERLDLAVEGAGLGVWDWDLESGEIKHNEQWAEMLGLPPEDGTVSIELVRDRFHPEDLPESEEMTQEVLTGEKSRYDNEIRRKTADGDWKWIRTVGQVAERDEDGNPTRAVGVNIDIDEYKTQKKELERFKTFVESSSDIIAHIDVDGTILYQSPAVEEIYGYDHEDIVGDNAFEYVHPNDMEKVAEEFYSILEDPEKDSGKVEYRVRDTDGEYIWTEAVGKDQRDTEAGGVVINERNITERKRKEKRLEEFARVVSHDLRNPLSVAEGRLELARKDCDSEHLDSVDDALDRMDTLIEDILTLSREGSSIDETETVETGELIEDCWQNVETENATLVTELEQKIQTDPERFKQLCENLVRNAVEHGDEEVTVNVGELDEKDGFYVADDGPGIPEEEREDAFETGYSTSEQGTGFGLRIVEQIVEAHGWEIEIKESQDEGARFEISGIDVL